MGNPRKNAGREIRDVASGLKKAAAPLLFRRAQAPVGFKLSPRPPLLDALRVRPYHANENHYRL
jgi:hypothetical protein